MRVGGGVTRRIAHELRVDKKSAASVVRQFLQANGVV
jgi:hypothetical protein